MKRLFVLSAVLLMASVALMGCGGGGGGGGGSNILVSVSPAEKDYVATSQALELTATVIGTTTQSVSWTLAVETTDYTGDPGLLDKTGPLKAKYTAPDDLGTKSSIVVLITAVSDADPNASATARVVVRDLPPLPF